MQAGIVAEVALVQLFLGVQGIDVLREVELEGCGVGTGIAEVIFWPGASTILLLGFLGIWVDVEDFLMDVQGMLGEFSASFTGEVTIWALHCDLFFLHSSFSFPGFSKFYVSCILTKFALLTLFMMYQR